MMQTPITITVEELHEQMRLIPSELELVDVRTLEKHQAFNIGGKHIPFEEMPQRFHELDKNKVIITYCTSGNRSMRALLYLQSLGFDKVRSLSGGMTAWLAK